MKDIIILGTGGNCLDILDAINELNRRAPKKSFRVLGFLDDDASARGREYFGCKVLGGLPDARRFPDACFVNGIGSPRNFWKKEDIIRTTAVPPGRFETIVHPCAAVSKFATLGRGCVVLPNVSISSRAAVGDHVIILPNAIISHDVRIGDYCCIASGACLAGGVELGAASYLGANCSLNNDVRIGSRSLIGMGAVVLKDLPEKSVAVGNPARIIRKTFRARVRR